MTSRNLNRTWLDIVVAQYKKDYEDDVPYPVRYLLYNPSWKADLFYQVPNKITPEVFKESVMDFKIYSRRLESPDFEDENIKVWKRVSPPVPEEVKAVAVPSTSDPSTHPVERRRQRIAEKLAARAAAQES